MLVGHLLHSPVCGIGETDHHSQRVFKIDQPVNGVTKIAQRHVLVRLVQALLPALGIGHGDHEHAAGPRLPRPLAASGRSNGFVGVGLGVRPPPDLDGTLHVAIPAGPVAVDHVVRAERVLALVVVEAPLDLGLLVGVEQRRDLVVQALDQAPDVREVVQHRPVAVGREEDGADRVLPALRLERALG